MKVWQNKAFRKNVLTIILLLVAFGVLMLLNSLGLLSRHLRSMLVPICINIILAVSLNLTVGFLGELTLGHAGFMSVGAYAGCLFSIATEAMLPMFIRFPLAMIVGGLCAGIFGVLIGLPVLRLHGDYLAIVTLAFGEILRSVIINFKFTGGASGLKGTPQDATFPIAFTVVLIVVLLCMNFVNSHHGRSVTAIRDNPIAAEACGIHVAFYRLLVFVIAAFFAGVAGVLYGHNLSILSAGTFDYNKSIELLVIVVLGGMGSIPGSIIASILITVLPEALRFLEDLRMLIYALVLIVMMLLNASPRFAQWKAKLNYRYLIQTLKEKRGRQNG